MSIQNSICDRCEKSGMEVTYVGENRTCKDCLFEAFDRREFRDSPGVCESCDQLIPTTSKVYCQSCAECSECDSLAYYCEDHANQSSECENCSQSASYCYDCATCEESHGSYCNSCGDDDEVYCEGCARDQWGLSYPCGDCGGEDDIDYHYCTTCDNQREYKQDRPARALEDGTFEVDDVSVVWN